MNLIPTKIEWKKWSKSKRLTAIGCLISVISLTFFLVDKFFVVPIDQPSVSQHIEEGTGVQIVGNKGSIGSIVFNEAPITYEIVTRNGPIFLGGTYTANIKTHPSAALDKINCIWSLEPSDLLEISANMIDDSSCNLTLKAPRIPISRLSAGMGTPARVFIQAHIHNGNKEVDKLEKVLMFHNYFEVIVKQSHHVISESSEVTVSVLFKQTEQKIPKPFKCEWLLETKPLKFLSTSENGCEGIISFDVSNKVYAKVFRKIATPAVVRMYYENQEFAAAVFNLKYDSQNKPPDVERANRKKLKNFKSSNERGYYLSKDGNCKPHWDRCVGYDGLLASWRGRLPSGLRLSFSVEPLNDGKVLAKYIVPMQKCEALLELKHVNQLFTESEFFFKPIDVTSGCKSIESINLHPKSSSSAFFTLTDGNGDRITRRVNKKVF